MAAQQEEQQQSRSAGKVLWFSDQKGFGFIRPDNGGEDLFVHQSAIKSDGYRSLAEGESVELIVSQGNGGKTQAVDVTSVGGYPKKDRRGGSWRGGNDRRNGNGGCYNCGSLNHLARDCTKNFSDYNNNDNYNTRSSCYNCGETGHFASECRRDSGGSGGGGGGAGKCFNCGKFGHFAKDCSRNSGRSNGNRFVCGGFGHMKKDCTSSRGYTCYNCGETGHLAKECTKTSA